MSSRSSLPYEIGRFHATCDSTGNALEPGSTFIAALIDDEHSELKRVNIQRNAWDSYKSDKHVFAYWVSTVSEAADDRADKVDHDSLLSVFESMIEHESDQPESRDDRAGLCFVLGLTLQRKRILVAVAHEADGGDELVLVPRSNKEAVPFRVPVPELDAEQLKSLTEQLRDLLHLEGDA